ncbi:MFS transporter [Paraburkholderia ferrariae]|uniref:MFS transporter n=1 Tax=Paraburkholderia ferrariae TaxID=386056 RepID=UPI000A02FF7A|nr:MFS transporter [Paraburkholderia ferrariae]
MRSLKSFFAFSLLPFYSVFLRTPEPPVSDRTSHPTAAPAAATTGATLARQPAAPTPAAAHRALPAVTRQRARLATMALFFIAGMMYASWGVHVPTVRDRFHLSPALLSCALFAVAGGSIAAMTMLGGWIARVGSRRACLAGGLTMSVCGTLILVVPWFWSLLVVLALFGVGMATLDVAMNAEASAVEESLGRPIMSALHGMFSLGGMAGAAIGGALLARGMAPALHLLLASALAALVLIVSCPAVLPHVPHPTHGEGAKTGNRWRTPALWALGGIALIALIAEGAMYDWATVYMRDVVIASPALASAAYAAFSGGMAAARFAGDAVRARFGAPQLVMVSASLACAGMIGALVLPFAATALIGFTLMGLGLANMMPVLFAAAARVKGIHAAEGLAHVAGIAYFGLLFGPVVIGGITQVTNLTVGLAVVALCAALVALAAPRVLRRLGI